jgi:RimJ/RimL family protein N-acetyltransferase
VADDADDQLREQLTAHNPLFGLTVRTPTVTLRMPTDPELLTLLGVINDGVHDPSWMPFRLGWTDVPRPQRDRDSLAHWWRLRAQWTPDDWIWCGAVHAGGSVVGVQDLMGKEFRVLREVTSGSWLGLAYQGAGIGKEMRAAILHLAFEELGAVRAHSSYVDGNDASRRVSESMGYVVNGTSHHEMRGEVRRQIHVVLERSEWERRRRSDIKIEGLEDCRELFGVA